MHEYTIMCLKIIVAQREDDTMLDHDKKAEERAKVPVVKGKKTKNMKSVQNKVAKRAGWMERPKSPPMTRKTDPYE